MTLSIDLGSVNLGWAKWKDNKLADFGLFNISEKLSERYLSSNFDTRGEILCEWLDQQNDIDTIVVEKQVFNNIIAMSLQYVICGYCHAKHILYIPFDARRKFVITGDKYNSKIKEHKRIVVDYAINIIKKYHSELLRSFQGFSKKDDLADAICMLFITASGMNSEELRSVMKGLEA